jgi:hypothetical protein
MLANIPRASRNQIFLLLARFSTVSIRPDLLSIAIIKDSLYIVCPSHMIENLSSTLPLRFRRFGIQSRGSGDFRA